MPDLICERLASWTPDGLVGQQLKALARQLSPPAGMAPPVLWGTEDRLRELLGEGISSLQSGKREFNFRFRSTEHFLEFCRRYFGPIKLPCRCIAKRLARRRSDFRRAGNIGPRPAAGAAMQPCAEGYG